jgi:hypothetical protein
LLVTWKPSCLSVALAGERVSSHFPAVGVPGVSRLAPWT